MPGFAIILLVLMFLVLIGCLYLVSNMNKRLNRMRKRYDMLLRGHTDINLEEYVLGLNGEMEHFKEERRQTEQKLYHVEQWMARTDTDQTAYVEERMHNLTHQMTEEMHASLSNLNANVSGIERETRGRLDAVEKETREVMSRQISSIRSQLTESITNLTRTVKKNEEDAFIHFDALEKALDTHQKQTSEKWQNMESNIHAQFKTLEGSLTERIGGVQTMTQNRFQSMEQKNEEAQSRLQRDLQAQVDQLMKETDDRLTKYQEDTNERLRSESSRIREQLSMAIQKVTLYRYNAFDDVAGETSFTAVLLDEHKNGLILTNIYSRQSTTTFAKEVQSGKAVQKLSPEEEHALEEAIRR